MDEVVGAAVVSGSLVVWPQAVEADFPYPLGVWVDTGEGGLFAYAVVEADDELLSAGRGEGGCVVSSFLSLSQYDNVVGGTEVFDPGDGGEEMESSVPLLGGIFLGMTNRALWRAKVGGAGGGYFAVTEADLDPRGVALMAALRAAYGRPVSIVTLLDT